MHTGIVDTTYLGIGLVLVIGIAVVAYGWLADRTETKRRQIALEQPPDRPIPGLAADAPAPSYVSKPEALKTVARTALSPGALATLKQRLAGSPSLAHGHAAPGFATDAGSGLCVLEQPWILVVDEPVTSIRELLPFLQKAAVASHPVVVVAPAIAVDVLGTLQVNAVSGKLANAAVLVRNVDQRRALCSLVDADPLTIRDLRAGYVPSSAIGNCDNWVSSTERLWILAD